MFRNLCFDEFKKANVSNIRLLGWHVWRHLCTLWQTRMIRFVCERFVFFASHVAVGDEGGALRDPPSSFDIWTQRYEIFAQNHMPIATYSNHSRLPKRANTTFETVVKNVSRASENSKHSLFSNSKKRRIRNIRQNNLADQATFWTVLLMIFRVNPKNIKK